MFMAPKNYKIDTGRWEGDGGGKIKKFIQFS